MSKQVDNKLLWVTVKELKEYFFDHEIFPYFRLPTEDMWADILTKKM